MLESLEESRILLLDDDPDVVAILERMLRRDGFSNVRALTDSREALPAFREQQPDLVILDVRMPHLDGLEVMRQLASRIPPGTYLPFLVISGEDDRSTRREALTGGAKDFISKPFDSLEVSVRVRNLLETRRLYARMETRLRHRTARLRRAQVEMAERLAAVAEMRDKGDGEHTRRVGRLSAAIARALGRPAAEVALIRRAAPLHDIGKAALPDALLLSPQRLSADEMERVKVHATLGARILSGSRSPLLQMAEEVALYHHENWDGTGYTPGLAGEAIPLVGRIVAVADVFDALTHKRPYKEPWSAQEALDWIRSESGRKFDPAVVDALAAVIDGGQRA